MHVFHAVGIVVQDNYSGEVKRKQKDSVAECKNRVKPILVLYTCVIISSQLQGLLVLYIIKNR